MSELETHFRAYRISSPSGWLIETNPGKQRIESDTVSDTLPSEPDHSGIDILPKSPASVADTMCHNRRDLDVIDRLKAVRDDYYHFVNPLFHNIRDIRNRWAHQNQS